MNKKWLFILCALFISAAINSQVALSLQVPPAGVMQKTQLWNMVIVYTGANPIDIYIGLSLLNSRDNRPVMTATTRPFSVSRGAKQVSATDIAPVQYSYLSPIFDIDRSPGGMLPIGNYKACYTVYKNEKGSVSPLAEDCIPVEVQPLSPPMLNMPADGAAIETGYPQFSWLPAVPQQLFSNLNYDLLLVEVLPGQTKGDAIQKNIPLYNAGFVKEPFNSYPASNKSLDTGRVYAWRVIAKNEDEYVAQTETWTFRVSSNTPKEQEILNDGYAVMEGSLKGIYIIKDKTLHVKYFSFDRTAETTIVYIDEKNEIVDRQQQTLAYGDNYLDLKMGRGLQEGRVYQIIITDKRNKKNSLKFRISKNQ